MTQLATLELLYNQFFSISKELRDLIESEDFDEAINKLADKDKLIKKIFTTKKTVTLSPEEEEKVGLIENAIKEKELENINLLKKMHFEVGIELNKTKKRVKVNSAYSIHKNEVSGVHIDISE